jgi:DNA-binding winged helix-turn-helix (wHTH) protein/tetratricopeptide (TPR) repeat protein
MYYEFGPFRLYPVERELRRGVKVIKLTDKRYELLLILLRCRGRVVKYDELMEAVWAGEIVEPGNLTVNISELRRTMKGARGATNKFINNIPKQGYRFTEPVSESGVRKTVAILPFKTVGSQKVSEEFGQAMADTLSTKLNKNMSILVTPSATVNREYREHPDQPPLIFGHRLAADYVFSGHIRREQDKLRVNVDFLDVRAGEPSASASFDEIITRSFELEGAIHKWMESVLDLNPTEREAEQSVRRYTKNPRADKSYRKGRVHRFTVTEASLWKAIHHFEQATREDPDFARAYANIADTYIFMGMLNLISPQESYEGARGAALMALEKDEDDSLASSHTAWGFTTLFFELRWEQAKDAFDRAVEINSNYSVARMGRAHWLAAQGEFEEAVDEINKAMSLDPNSFFISFVRGMVFFQSRRYAESLEYFERTHELNVRFNLKSDLSHYGLSLAYAQLARAASAGARRRLFKRADAEARRAITLSDRHPLKLLQRAYVKAARGKRAEARKILDEVLKPRRPKQYVSQYHLGIVYAALKEPGPAVKCLAQAHRERDQYLFLLNVDPRLDSLRGYRGFKKLLVLMGLEKQE